MVAASYNLELIIINDYFPKKVRNVSLLATVLTLLIVFLVSPGSAGEAAVPHNSTTHTTLPKT